ncbi:hypothetical protein DSM3645_03528 [Blastopirellula marina DSM 3645]|uniref:Uncharacterized protein n=1 Tax=Blastopirellula marina DSM 3645 TaxID=314230 RepID=A3ZW19_9BACT|nr:hypothetical protein DSM3645_03528 [Blastopirellula marina DSM 3645]
MRGAFAFLGLLVIPGEKVASRGAVLLS